MAPTNPVGAGANQRDCETGIPTIAHHHDFAWERKRFWLMKQRLFGGRISRSPIYPACGD